MKIVTLGTSHGGAEKGRACSGTLLEINGSRYLFDCGGNAESKMMDMGLPVESIRCVFLSHMHEDHVGSLSSVVKRFTGYIKTGECVKVFFPEEEGLSAFKNWLYAMHFDKARLSEKVMFELIHKGEIYKDENIRVSTVATKHLYDGKYPSFAFSVESKEGKILYTGDLACDFHDYPDIVFSEDFDAVVCELVHFDVKNNFETIVKTRTKKLIFTHMRSDRVEEIENIKHRFPFSVYIAEDNMEFCI